MHRRVGGIDWIPVLGLAEKLVELDRAAADTTKAVAMISMLSVTNGATANSQSNVAVGNDVETQ